MSTPTRRSEALQRLRGAASGVMVATGYLGFTEDVLPPVEKKEEPEKEDGPTEEKLTSPGVSKQMPVQPKAKAGPEGDLSSSSTTSLEETPKEPAQEVPPKTPQHRIRKRLRLVRHTATQPLPSPVSIVRNIVTDMTHD